MEKEVENRWTGKNSYLVIASHNGKFVIEVVQIDAEEDYAKTHSQRRHELEQAIRPAALGAFGLGAIVDITWLKGRSITAML